MKTALLALLTLAVIATKPLPAYATALLDVDENGIAEVSTDVVYVARHLLGLPPVPESFREGEPGIPPDETIIANIDALGELLDVDGDGTTDVATDVVYLARHLLGLMPAPDSFREVATIPADGDLAANASRLLVDCGNGTLEGAEECDDGGTAGGDGCAADCMLESPVARCAGASSTPGTALRAELVADVVSPVHLSAPPLDPHRLFIVEQAGRVRIVEHGWLLPEPFLDIRDIVSTGVERGLLSIAFHPDYETNGRFFINYTNNSGDTVVARYEVSPDPDAGDPTSARTLFTVDQPFVNHNGGQLAFGPDGMLYVGMGDGGSGGDPQENAQSDDTVLGKLLRLDVDVEDPPYWSAPADNPNPDAPGLLAAIWAKGVRNPWRFAFDRATGELYIADVGQSSFEEVSVQPPASTGGENYGWDIYEGTSCFDPQPDFESCDDAPAFTMPVFEYSHAQGCSITGGFVYRGCALPDLEGHYFYSDFCSAFVRSFVLDGGSATQQADRTDDLNEGGVLIDDVTSFGEDARGEIYVCDQGGAVYRVAPE